MSSASLKKFRDLTKLVVSINAMTRKSFLDADDENLKESLSKSRQELINDILCNELNPSARAINQLSNRLMTEAITTCGGGTPHLYYAVLLKEWILTHYDQLGGTRGSIKVTAGSPKIAGGKTLGGTLINAQFLSNLARGHFELWTRKGVAADSYHILRAKELFELAFQNSIASQEAHNQMMYVKILQFLGEIDKAAATIQSILHQYENDPEYANYLFYAGGLYKALGDYDKASTYFFEASQIGPPKYFTKLDMMIIISRTLEQQQALQDHGDSDEEDAYKMVHAHLIMEGHLEEETEYEDWMGNAHTWMHLGDKCALHHMFALATDLYGLAVMKDTDAFRKPMLWFRFAKACHRCGRSSDAQLAVKQALTATPFNQQLRRTQKHWTTNSTAFQEAVQQPIGDILSRLPLEMDVEQKTFNRLQALVKGILERYQLRLGVGTRRDIHQRMTARLGMMIADPLRGGRQFPILLSVSPSWLGKITHIDVYDVQRDQRAKVLLKVPFAPIKEAGVPRKLQLTLSLRRIKCAVLRGASPLARQRQQLQAALHAEATATEPAITGTAEMFDMLAHSRAVGDKSAQHSISRSDTGSGTSSENSSNRGSPDPFVFAVNAAEGEEEITELVFKFTDVLTGQYLYRTMVLKVQITPSNFSKYNLDMDGMQEHRQSHRSLFQELGRSVSTRGSGRSTAGGSMRRMDSILESVFDEHEIPADVDIASAGAGINGMDEVGFDGFNGSASGASGEDATVFVVDRSEPSNDIGSSNSDSVTAPEVAALAAAVTAAGVAGLHSFSLSEVRSNMVERISVDEGPEHSIVTCTNIQSAELLREVFPWKGRYYLIRVINDRDVTQVTMLEFRSNVMFVFLMARENIDRSFRLRMRWQMLMEIIDSSPLLRQFVQRGNNSVSSSDGSSSGCSSGGLTARGFEGVVNPAVINGKHCLVHLLPRGQGATTILVDPENKPMLGLSFELVEQTSTDVATATVPEKIVAALPRSSDDMICVPSYSQQTPIDGSLRHQSAAAVGDEGSGIGCEGDDSAAASPTPPPSVVIRMSSLRQRRDSQSFRSPLIDEFLSGNASVVVAAATADDDLNGNKAFTPIAPAATVVPNDEDEVSLPSVLPLSPRSSAHQETDQESIPFTVAAEEAVADIKEEESNEASALTLVPTRSMVLKACNALLEGCTFTDALVAATTAVAAVDSTATDLFSADPKLPLAGSEENDSSLLSDNIDDIGIDSDSALLEFIGGKQQQQRVDDDWIRNIGCHIAVAAVLDDTVESLEEALLEYITALYCDHLLPHFAAGTARLLDDCLKRSLPEVIRHRRKKDSADCASAAVQFLTDRAVELSGQSQLLAQQQREAEERAAVEAAAEAAEKAQLRAAAKARALEDGRLEDRRAYRDDDSEEEESMLQLQLTGAAAAAQYQVTKIDSLRAEQKLAKRDSLVPVMNVKPARLRRMPSVLLTERSLAEFRTPSNNTTGNNTARSHYTDTAADASARVAAAFSDEDADAGSVTSLTRDGAYFTSAAVRDGERTLFGDAVADPASPLPSRAGSRFTFDNAPAMLSSTAPAVIGALSAPAATADDDDSNNSRNSALLKAMTAPAAAAAGGLALPPPMLQLPMHAFDSADALKQALQQWNNTTHSDVATTTSSIETGGDGLALHKVSILEEAMLQPYKQHHAVTRTGGGRLANKREDDGSVSISNGSYDSSSSPFMTVQRRQHPAAVAAQSYERDAGSVVSNASSLTDAHSMTFHSLHLTQQLQQQRRGKTSTSGTRKKLRKHREVLTADGGSNGSLGDNGSSVSSLRSAGSSLKSATATALQQQQQQESGRFQLNPIVNITQDRERIKQEISEASLHDIRKIGYVQRRPLPYATHWRDKLLEFVFSLPSVENLLKRASTLLRTAPRALTIEEAVCALADTGGSAGEAVDRLQHSVELYAEIKLVCRTVHVRSLVCMREGGERLFRDCAADLSTPEIRSTSLAFKNASPPTVRLNPAIRDYSSSNTSNSRSGMLQLQQQQQAPNKNANFVLMPSLLPAETDSPSPQQRLQQQLSFADGAGISRSYSAESSSSPRQQPSRRPSRSQQLSAKQPSFNAIAAATQSSRQLQHSDQHPFYGYQRSSGGAAGGMGRGTVEGNVIATAAAAAIAATATMEELETRSALQLQLLSRRGSSNLSADSDDAAYFWRDGPITPPESSSNFSRNNHNSSSNSSGNRCGRILPPGMQSLMTLPSARTSQDLSSQSNAVRSRATQIKLVRATSQLAHAQHFLRNAADSVSNNSRRKQQQQVGGFWSVTEESLVVVEGSEEDEDGVDNNNSNNNSIRSNGAPVLQAKLHPRDDMAAAAVDSYSSSEMTSSNSSKAHQMFKNWSHSSINNVRLDPDNHINPALDLQQQHQQQLLNQQQLSPVAEHGDQPRSTTPQPSAQKKKTAFFRSPVSLEKSAASELAARSNGSQAAVASPLSPSKVHRKTAVALRGSNITMSGSKNNNNRVEGRIDELMQQHGDSTVAVLCRRDFLKAQQEQTLLKSDKRYIRDHVERKLAVGASAMKTTSILSTTALAGSAATAGAALS